MPTIRTLADLLPRSNVVRPATLQTAQPTDPDLQSAEVRAPGRRAARPADRAPARCRTGGPAAWGPTGSRLLRQPSTYRESSAVMGRAFGTRRGCCQGEPRPGFSVDEVNAPRRPSRDVLRISPPRAGTSVERRGGVFGASPRPASCLIGSGNPEEGELRPRQLARPFPAGAWEVRPPRGRELRVQVGSSALSFDADPRSFNSRPSGQPGALQERAGAGPALASISVSDRMTICAFSHLLGLRGELMWMACAVTS